MSKATRDAFYRQVALPEELDYANAADDDDVQLPLTRAGFELLLTEICGRFGLPPDDGCRAVLAGYIHHIPNDKHITTIQELGIALHKSISNDMTWQVDQEIKEARRAEQAAEQKAKAETTPLTVVGDSADGSTPQGA